MKKILLAAVLALATIGVSAHPASSVHHHDQGHVVYDNTIAPKVEVRFETDRWDRRIRVTETTRCTETRINQRNNHIRCIEEETETTRVIVDNPRPRSVPSIDPVIYRVIEVDSQGRRVIITTTYTCVRSGYDDNKAVCYRWTRDESREYVRRPQGDRGFDLNGDGRTDPWERALFQGFSDALND